MEVRAIEARLAREVVEREHYLHRKPPCSFAYGLFAPELVGVVVFGCPASHEMRAGACPSDPSRVVELNRLWVHDRMPRNTESWFVSRALALMPARIVLSYADTAMGHFGVMYRACNFDYAGWTDMDRKTPRFDYIVPGKHSRDAFRGGKLRADAVRVRRKPKIKFWTVTGDKRERRDLRRACRWPSLSWAAQPFMGVAE